MPPDPPTPVSPAGYQIKPWQVLLCMRLDQLIREGYSLVELELDPPAIVGYRRRKREKLTNGKIEPTIKTTDGA